MQSFFQLTQESLDFAKIIDKFSAVFKSVGLDEIREHFDNIGSMFSCATKSVKSMVEFRMVSIVSLSIPSLYSINILTILTSSNRSENWSKEEKEVRKYLEWKKN